MDMRYRGAFVMEPYRVQMPISPFFAKLILRLNPFSSVLVMCKGYNECYRMFAELVWEDDRDLDFSDRESYPEFQLWVR